MTGFIATMQTRVRTYAVEKAATAAGLASRLGASDARLQGYALSNPEAAQARANTAAVAVATRRATALASGAGLRLGPIVTVRDQASYDITVTGAALGASAMAATTGGQPYGNIGKIYADPTMTAAEGKALNDGIQRVAESPAALAYLTRWHEATGRIADPLVTMHNRIDSLVPYAQETALKATVARIGRSANLAEYPVAPLRAPLPVGGVEACTHCGFTPDQTKAAWQALRGWVATGRRPAADAVK
ncbi:DUF541 domain-containing protein [Sphingomonas sp. UV9]|nr:DUF541 domain-containing protein [Sphingomonas sp. UV9]